jgi:hypothetical protein
VSWTTRVACLFGALTLLAAIGIDAAHAQSGQGPSWGAIAAVDESFGYAYNHPTRSEAELAARAQCDRAAGRQGACTVRAYFDRYCGALARGNFGEWASTLGASKEAAGKEAVQLCNSHLPTEPCKVMVSVCSPR